MTCSLIVKIVIFVRLDLIEHVMDRRNFLKVTGAGIAAATVGSTVDAFAGDRSKKSDKAAKAGAGQDPNEDYSIVILGDTHWDMGADAPYHVGYSDPNPTREKNHWREIARNGEMWKGRCPGLVKAAGAAAGVDTKMFLHMGDMIQGDTGSLQQHKDMLDGAVTYLKGLLGEKPFVTVVGNHDIRMKDENVGAQAYKEYMTQRMSQELGRKIEKTTFAFWVGKDAYIVIDFVRPDDEEVERLFKETEGARYTFVVIHCPVLPYDNVKYYNWIYHCRKEPSQSKRLHFRELFAKRGVIVLCGHSHTTECAEWWGDGGRITQMTMSSVWSKDELGKYFVEAQGADEYGRLREASQRAKGIEVPAEETALFDEYRPGLKAYTMSHSCGYYKLHVSDYGVYVDFYAGDDATPSHTFILR